MSFSPTIDIGDVIKFVAMVGSALWFIAKMSGQLHQVTSEIKALKDIVATQSEQIAAFAKALIDLARQEERINAIDRRVEDLRRGRGFIEHEVDGEYTKAGKVR